MDKPTRSASDLPRAPLARAEAQRLADLEFLHLIGVRVPENGGNQPQKYSTDRLTVGEVETIFNHMVEYKLDATFHALSDPTRRGMLAHLALGETSMGELARPFAMSLAGASKHVKVLEGAGLVSRRKAGRIWFCKLEPKPLAQADQWLRQWEKFWNVRLDRLEAMIAAEKERRG